MVNIISYSRAVIAVFFLVLMVVLPVSGMSVPVGTPAPTDAVATVSPVISDTGAVSVATTTPAPTATATITAAATGSQPFISAMVTPANPVVGDAITISGTASGGNLTQGVQIWIFAGNYINVMTVPVNAQGQFSKTYQTTDLPPATYYSFVQSPSTNGKFDIVETDANGYSGQVINTVTGATIFSFTGTGSVHDMAAVTALSDAFNLPNVDDIYTKLSFTLAAPGTNGAVFTSDQGAPVQTTAKSPVSFLTVLAGICVAGLAVVMMRRQ